MLSLSQLKFEYNCLAFLLRLIHSLANSLAAITFIPCVVQYVAIDPRYIDVFLKSNGVIVAEHTMQLSTITSRGRPSYQLSLELDAYLLTEM